MSTETIEAPSASPPATPPAAAVETPPAVATTPPAPPAADVPPAEPAQPEAAPTPTLPEKYDLKVPENSPISGDYAESLQAKAKAVGLTQEQFEKFTQLEHDAVVAGIQELEGQMADLKADPVLGGAHFETTVKHALTGMREFFGDDKAAAEALWNQLNLANNKILVKAFARHGKRFAEDTNVSGGARTTTPKTAADVLYGTPAKE